MRNFGVVFTIIASLFACNGATESETQSPAPAGTIKVTVLFEGLIAYLKEVDNDDVWVLLVDARERQGRITAHVPMVTFRSTDADRDDEVLNEVPWILNGEDIHIGADEPGQLTVNPEVWTSTGSLTKLARPNNPSDDPFHDDLDEPNQTPTHVVARLKLSRGDLSVDDRNGGSHSGQTEFKTAAGQPHPDPNYHADKIALAIKYVVEVDRNNFRIWTNKYETNDVIHEFELHPSENELYMFIGNVPAENHGTEEVEGMYVDRDFARLYDLIEPPVGPKYIPYVVDQPLVGRRACMGGGR